MTRRPTRRPGLLSLVSLFVLLALFVLLGLVWNVTRVTHRKLEAQTAADGTAQAAGVQLARALNAVTTDNHEIGEANAAAVLAFAYIGPEYESGAGLDVSDRSTELELAYARALQVVDPTTLDTELFERVRPRRTRCGGAIGAARRQLMARLAGIYDWLALPGNAAKKQEALRLQKAIAVEWDRLDVLEQRAPALLEVKQRTVRKQIPDLHAHAREVVAAYPARAEEAAAAVARLHGATGTLFPTARGAGAYPLVLPVVSERSVVEAHGWEWSQMVRATTPWVQYRRKPMIEAAARDLPVSGFAGHYLHFTQAYTLRLSEELGTVHGLYLFVLADAGPDKGTEPWATRDGSRLADRRFGLLGFAHRSAPDLMGGPVYRQPNPAGLAAFAQVLAYNANPQEPTHVPPGRSPADWQRRAGWDTLNWHPDVPVPEFRSGNEPDTADLVREPRVHVNWRVKLVPASLLSEAAGSQGEPLDVCLRQTPTGTWVSTTH